MSATNTHTSESIQLRHVYHHNIEESGASSSTFKDPLFLKSKLQTEHYIKKDLKGQKRLQDFYTNQNEIIENMLTALDTIPDAEKQEKQLLKVRFSL